MTVANRNKYAQNSGVRSALLATAGTRLVECSPFDDHWGVGVSLDNIGTVKEITWGSNLMGGVLSTIREELLQKAAANMEQQ
jgi:hypothetical protein